MTSPERTSATDDFLADQLAACGPLEFVRFWTPAADPEDRYVLAAEVVHEEEPAGYTVSVSAPGRPELEEALAGLGFSAGRAVLPPGDVGTLADLVRSVLRLVTATQPKVSLTHGTRAELLQRRRIEAVMAELNRIFSTELVPHGWHEVTTPPISVGVGGAVVELVPIPAGDSVLLEAVVQVVDDLPDTPEVAELVARCNEGFTIGRFVRRGNRLEYRDIVHAEPLGTGALRMMLSVAGTTARQYAPQFVELGATDRRMPADDTPEPPRPNFTYL